MDDKFNQLAVSIAESVTRRQGPKRFAGCGKPGQGGGGSRCSKSFFCEISADTGRQCFCN